MINLQLVFGILLVHFLADFALQTHEQSTRKSTSNLYLAYNVCVYTLIFGLFAMTYTKSVEFAIWFSLITFLFHFGTDYLTSRIGKPFWEKKDFHNGFVVVGFDQLLHYGQLILTYKLLEHLI